MGRKLLTREQLIEEAKKIENLEERALFVMRYFLDTVSYDYAYLLGAGFAQGDIKQITGKKIAYKNPFKKDGNNLPYYYMKYQTDVAKGENGELLDHSEMIADISRIESEVSANGGSYDDFLKAIRKYLSDKLKEHLDNDGLVEQNVSKLMNFLLSINKLQGKCRINGQETTIGYSIGYALMELVVKKDEIFMPIELKDGLITRGVCENYSEYIIPILKELGIDAYEVNGTSELNHSWICVRINGALKSVDLTRAVFIRDGCIGIPKDQTMDEWLYCSMQRALDMQSTRTIREINGLKLDEIIDASNYDEEKLNQLLLESDRKKKKINPVNLNSVKRYNLRNKRD